MGPLPRWIVEARKRGGGAKCAGRGKGSGRPRKTDRQRRRADREDRQTDRFPLIT